jgi:sulfide dehydrogenase cytochrome subunit
MSPEPPFTTGSGAEGEDITVFGSLSKPKGGNMAKTTLNQLVLAGALALSTSSAAFAGTSVSMLVDTCAGCHGTDGVSVGPATPTIAGISTEYFVEYMQAFKSGEAPSTIMGRIVKGYEDEDIEKMAEYFAKQKFVPAKQDYDKTLVKKGRKLHDKYCEKCHAEGGTSAEDDSGILAGQWTTYLRWTMDDFKADRREAPKKMKKKVSKLLEKEGDEGLKALDAYYASQQ